MKSKLFMDDLGLRLRAQNDPGLTLSEVEFPCLIDEAQYCPHLFPEIKLKIDQTRRERLRKAKSTKTQTLFFLTGSNRILLDKNVKESLAGRCHIFEMHGFSVREILAAFPSVGLKTILFLGGFPELYVHTQLSPVRYLNDYILGFVEKDIAQSAGIQKLAEFQTVLHLLAARTGQFLNLSEISAQAGVEAKTVQAWIEILERNFILKMLPAFTSNLSKRIVKMKKLFFYDTGLCARLQSHLTADALWNSSQVGSLFETLVFSEIVKTKSNFLKEWNLFTWRTKDQREVDFVLQDEKGFLFIEAKLSIHGARAFDLDPEALKVFPTPHRKIVVTAGGEKAKLSANTWALPLSMLGDYLCGKVLL